MQGKPFSALQGPTSVSLISAASDDCSYFLRIAENKSCLQFFFFK